jgi:hypothetical protein
MKKNVLLTAVTVFIAIVTQAQITITSDITSNTNWTNDNIYTLSGGFIYVTNNATLTIEPGTIVKGDQATLVITRGAKIIAEGTATQPIVFTSARPAGQQRSPGDWGGIIICGKAPVNDPAGERLGEGGIDPVKGLYGGTDVNDNSGVLKYVRIEYAGVAYQPNNETNSLTMGGVGLGTTIDYVQVSYGGDDGFEWFGGTVNCKHLVVNKTVDDMFDTDYGFTGRIQFAVGVSDSLVADVSGSNGFESDNDAGGTTNSPITKPIFSNVSIFGPRATSSSTGFNSNFKRALHLRRSSSTCTYNSIFVGFPTGLKIDGTTTGNNCTSGTLQFKNNIIAGSSQPLDSTSLTFGMKNWFNSNGNSILTNPQDVQSIAPFSYTAPNFLLQVGSPASTGADFTAPNLNNPFFETTSYRGAFDGTNDWTACWTNFDPQNANYNSPNYGLSANATFSSTEKIAKFVNTSVGATTYSWNFGDNTTSTDVDPEHTFETSGTYKVTLTASNGSCSDSYDFDVKISVTGINEISGFTSINLYPNPATDQTILSIESSIAQSAKLVLNNQLGQIVKESTVYLNDGVNKSIINTNELRNGLYFVNLYTENGAITRKLFIRK